MEDTGIQVAFLVRWQESWKPLCCFLMQSYGRTTQTICAVCFFSKNFCKKSSFRTKKTENLKTPPPFHLFTYVVRPSKESLERTFYKPTYVYKIAFGNRTAISFHFFVPCCTGHTQPQSRAMPRKKMISASKAMAILLESQAVHVRDTLSQVTR